MNIVTLIGRITKKPELEYTPNTQTAVTKFTIAVDRETKEGGADFIRVTAFGRRAEAICRYMDKGRAIAVQGKLQTGSYKDREGKTVYTQDVIIDKDEFLGSKAPASQASVPTNPETTFDEYDGFSASNDDVPF